MLHSTRPSRSRAPVVKISRPRPARLDRVAWLLVFAIAPLALAGCGGGGGGGGGAPAAPAPTAPVGLNYASPGALTVGAALAAITPTLTDGTSNDYTIMPALPAGLTLDPMTGEISGTPTAASPLTTYTITATNAGGSTTFDLDLEVLPPPTPTITFAMSSNSASEGSGAITVEVSLSEMTTVPVSVDVIDAGGTATVGVDFDFTATTLTIAPGDTLATTTVTVLDDNIDEPAETVTLALANPIDGVLGGGDYTLTITDDDASPGVAFPLPTQMVTEGTPTATITLTFDRPASTDRTVTLSLSGSATAGSDFSLSNTTVTFLAGETMATVDVTIVDDALFEGAEELVLTVIPGADVQAGAITDLILTIGENDPAPSVELSGGTTITEGTGLVVLTATLSDIAAVDTTVDFLIGGTASLGIDYTVTTSPITITAGSLSASIVIDPLTDSDDEGDETVEVTLISASPAVLGAVTVQTLTIQDPVTALPEVNVSGGGNILEGAGLVNFTVTLSAMRTTAVTVDFDLTGTATPGVDFLAPANPVTIPAGALSALISIEPIDDGIVEGTETVDITLTGATGATLGTSLTAAVTIEETPVLSASISGGTTILESDAPIDLMVSLSGPAPLPTNVLFAVAGTATPGADFLINSSPLTIPQGASFGFITIEPLPDSMMESTETIEVTLLAVSGGQVAAPATATVNLDNVSQPTVTLSGSGQMALEGSGLMTVTVNLSAPLTQNVIVDFGFAGTATPGSDYLATASPVAIVAGTTATTIGIDPLADSLIEGDETVIVQILTASGGAAIGAADQAILTIEDDNSSPVPPTGLTYSEQDAIYTPGVAIAPNVPMFTGGGADSYSVLPFLPAGLDLDPVTGVITGTPLAEQPQSQYTITASNAVGATSTMITIQVQANFDFEFAMPTMMVPYNTFTGAANFVLPLTVQELLPGGAQPTEIIGLAGGILYDANEIDFSSVQVGSGLTGLNGGAGPDFYIATPIAGGGLTFGIIFDFMQNASITAATAAEWASIDFQANPAFLAGNQTGDTVTVTWDSTLGSPPVENLITPPGGQTEIVPGLIDGVINFVP